MNRSLSIFLVASVSIIIAFFTWQLILHKRLEASPTSCTGDKYVNNSCVLGEACVAPDTASTRNLFSIPTTSGDSLRIINEFKQSGRSTGLCIPWASFWLNLPLNSTIEN